MFGGTSQSARIRFHVAGVPVDVSEHISGTARPRWVGWASTVTGGAVVLFGVFSGQAHVARLGAIGAANGIARIRPRGLEGAVMIGRNEATKERA